MDIETNTRNSVGILAKLRRHIRGRVFSALLLSTILGMGGAYWGYKNSKPIYRSNGILRITPLVLKILYAQSDIAPSVFDSFVDVQVNIMRSRPVVEAILLSPEWKLAHRDDETTDVEVYLRDLEITHPTRSEIVNISYSGTSPLVAVTGVRSLIDSYLRIYGDRSGNQRIVAVEKRAKDLNEELDRERAQLAKITQKYGTDDLKQLYQTKINELGRLEAMIKETEINFILAEAALGNVDEAKKMPVEEIAAADEIMKKLVEERRLCELELSNQRRGEEHPIVLALKEKLSKINSDITQRADAFRNFHRSSFVNNVGVLEGVPTPAAVDSLRQRLKKLQELHDSSLQNSLELGRENLQANSIMEEMKATKERLAENQGKLEQLRVDSSVVGQINVISHGEFPPGPIKDKRKTMAGAGFICGFSMGTGVILLLGFVRPRLRHSSDVRCVACETPLLGVLPELPVRSDEAASCMRQIATTLQTDPDLLKAKVIAVTSPKTGNGSTSFAAALAVTFASLGKKTLLIDADLVGHGLFDSLVSEHVGAKLFGGGLSNILAGDKWEEQIMPTALPQLSLLTIGPKSHSFAGPICSESMRRLFAKAAEQYDRVIVDTASLDQCMETLYVCREAETVLMLVCRDTNDSDVTICRSKLQATGATIGGFVFNRAAFKDERSFLPKNPGQSTPESSKPWLVFGEFAASVIANSPYRDVPCLCI